MLAPVPVRPKGTAAPAITQINLKIPEDLLASVDAWVEEVNDGRWPKLTRSDVIRSLLAWGVRERPEWVAK